MGRPPRDPDGATSRLHAIRLTDDEKINYEWAAKRAKMTVSAWIRDRLNKAVTLENKRARDAKKRAAPPSDVPGVAVYLPAAKR